MQDERLERVIPFNCREKELDNESPFMMNCNTDNKIFDENELHQNDLEFE